MELSNKYQIFSVNDLIRHYERVEGGHFFSRDNMRFFKSRISDGLYYGKNLIYFVTSEKGPNEIRAYSVRSYDPISGEIETVGEFQAYKSISGAKKAAERLAHKEFE